MNDKPETDVQSLAAEINHLREDFSRIGKTLEMLVRSRGSAAAAGAGRTAEQAWDEVSKTAETAVQAMERNPLTTLAAVFGFGLLMGMLFGGRRS